jgi:hypothetical protein
MASSSLLQSITASALIGTERQPFKPIATDGNLGKLLANIDPSDGEIALLNTLAAIALYEQAGKLPLKHDSVLPNVCDLDDLPKCSDRTAYFLQLTMSEHSELLPEILSALAANGQRVNETSLPLLLDLGKRQSDLREAIATVLGKRGQWLAAQNPDWNYIATTDDASIWETGNKFARLMWLKQQRKQNPNQAREYLESTWKQETASDRTAFLEVFETNLSMADEPFLESLLGDRSKDVRRVTIDLLSCLPESRYCQRMTERVQNLVKLVSEGEQIYFSIDLPELLTPEMIRDGIIQKSPDASIGDRGFWLLQAIAATPLDFWTKQFSLSTSDLLKAAISPKSDPLIERGIILAAEKTGDLKWIQALLNVLTSKQKKNDIFNNLTLHGSKVISKILSDPNHQTTWLEIIKNPDLEFSDIQTLLLLGGDEQRNYSPELSQAVMKLIDQNIDNLIQNHRNSRKNHWSFCEFIRKSSTFIFPSQIPTVIATMLRLTQQIQQPISEDQEKGREWVYIKASLQNSIDQFIEALQLRQEMLKSITDKGVII